MPNMNGLLEATRLTRTGQLTQALSLLRGLTPAHLPHAAQSPPDGGSFAGLQAGRDRGQLPEALRGFLDNIGQLGKTPNLPSGLDGLVTPRPTHTPAPLPDGARFETRTFANEAGSRAYKLYVPSGYRGQRAAARGHAARLHPAPDDFAAGTRMNELAEEHGSSSPIPAQPPSANAQQMLELVQARRPAARRAASPRSSPASRARS